MSAQVVEGFTTTYGTQRIITIHQRHLGNVNVCFSKKEYVVYIRSRFWLKYILLQDTVDPFIQLPLCLFIKSEAMFVRLFMYPLVIICNFYSRINSTWNGQCPIYSLYYDFVTSFVVTKYYINYHASTIFSSIDTTCVYVTRKSIVYVISQRD